MPVYHTKMTRLSSVRTLYSLNLKNHSMDKCIWSDTGTLSVTEFVFYSPNLLGLTVHKSKVN